MVLLSHFLKFNLYCVFFFSITIWSPYTPHITPKIFLRQGDLHVLSICDHMQEISIHHLVLADLGGVALS